MVALTWSRKPRRPIRNWFVLSVNATGTLTTCSVPPKLRVRWNTYAWMDVPPTPVRVTGVPSVSVSPRELARDEGAREYVAPVSKRAVVAKFAEFPGLT